MTTTKRADLRSGLFTGIEAWRTIFNAGEAKETNHVRQSYRARPASFHPPCVYIGPVTESITYTSGIRTRDQRAQIVLVRGIYENAETAEWQDRASDSLLDYLTANPHLVSPLTLLSATGTEDAELDNGDVRYAAVVVTLRHDVAEGRV